MPKTKRKITHDKEYKNNCKEDKKRFFRTKYINYMNTNKRSGNNLKGLLYNAKDEYNLM